MKNIIILITLLATMNTYADTLVKMTTGSAWPFYRVHTIAIEDTGVVTETIHSGVNMPSTVKELATLSDASLEALQDQVAKLTPLKLIEANPDAPECFDAPTTTILATLSNGEQMKFYQNIQCKEYILLDWINGPIATSIQNILQGLGALAVL